MNPAEIPPWSTVVSRHGVLFAPLCQFGGNLYGWTAYIQARDDQQADAEFCDHRWIKTLGLPYDRYRPLVEHIPGLVDDRLGRLARVELNDISWSVSPRDQMLLREHDHTLNALAELLEVPIAALGIYGSTVYKSPGARSDFDFVIHGERHARSALAMIRPYSLLIPHIRKLTAACSTCGSVSPDWLVGSIPDSTQLIRLPQDCSLVATSHSASTTPVP